MSIASVTTRGYSIAGGFQAGTLFLPTLGFGSGEGGTVARASAYTAVCGADARPLRVYGADPRPIVVYGADTRTREVRG